MSKEAYCSGFRGKRGAGFRFKREESSSRVQRAKRTWVVINRIIDQLKEDYGSG